MKREFPADGLGFSWKDGLQCPGNCPARQLLSNSAWARNPISEPWRTTPRRPFNVLHQKTWDGHFTRLIPLKPSYPKPSYPEQKYAQPQETRI